MARPSADPMIFTMPWRAHDAVGDETPNGGPLNQSGHRSQSVGQSGRMFSACGPFWPWVMSNSTFWFSSRLR
jgi:hypothetical protein